jgi:F0F1-type ATP synthase gamma subunit
LETIDVSPFPKKNLIVAMTTDKGLCGGVNTILCRMTRQLFNKITADGKDYEIFVLGEKGL